MSTVRSIPTLSRRWRCWALACALLASSWGGLRGAAPTVTPEYQLKAVFLFNFAQFVDWPAAAFATSESPLVIGVLGEDPFGPYLDDLIRDEKIAGRPLVIRRYRRSDDIRDCHLVFICRSEAREMGGLIERIRPRPVLTVSDAENFTRDGGMVRFALENSRIRLRINVEAAKAAGLNISSKILRLGTIVTPAKD